MSRLQWTQKLLERITVQNQATHRGWSYLPHSRTADSKNEHATHWNVFDCMLSASSASTNQRISFLCFKGPTWTVAARRSSSILRWLVTELHSFERRWMFVRFELSLGQCKFSKVLGGLAAYACLKETQDTQAIPKTLPSHNPSYMSCRRASSVATTWSSCTVRFSPTVFDWRICRVKFISVTGLFPRLT